MIQYIKVPSQSGLHECEMFDLRKIVLLTGPNGSGKSRLLKLIADLMRSGSRSTIEYELYSGLDRRPTAVQFASQTRFANPETLNRAVIVREGQRGGDDLGTSRLATNCLTYIQYLQNRWFEATHANSSLTTKEKETAEKCYDDLQELIRSVLGESISRDADGRVQMYGMHIPAAHLSEGQKALLLWCASLHSQGSSLKDILLLMDEPENHLHSEKMIETVERILCANDDGQTWIATHSVTLVAHLYHKHQNDLSLYVMKDGKLNYAMTNPDGVLKSLLGGESNVDALREFIDLPEIIAINRFAAQCLVGPSVVSGDDPGDPQVEIVDVDRWTAHHNRRVRVLDYGCGKGRLLDTLFAIHGDDLREKIDYVGWDVGEDERIECEQVIQKCYGSASGRWFSNRQDLAGSQDSKFDRIVLCNVLHEIEPDKWPHEFDETSVISRHLSEEGFVVIIEDYRMPTGERAHRFGFIVLDTEPLQTLFGVSDRLHSEFKHDGRIKGHFIPKRFLANVTAETKNSALLLAKRHARERIEATRTASDFKTGREHAFWVQQFANTSMALRE